MKEIRKAKDRGRADYGWLKSHHSFSFGNYHNPERINWGPLRVINDDQVAPGAGFPTHPHRDMEIFSYVTKGTLAHEDSLGNREHLTPGKIQLMSAGTGIQHSEFNPSDSEPTHFLQIWIQPNTTGLEPSYQELNIEAGSDVNQWRLLMQSNKTPETAKVLKIHQDASVMVAKLQPGHPLSTPDGKDRKGYLHVVSGTIETTDSKLSEGDALAFADESSFQITAIEAAELLYFDLPK